jgi:hypothetical protein
MVEFQIATPAETPSIDGAKKGTEYNSFLAKSPGEKDTILRLVRHYSLLQKRNFPLIFF